MSLVATATWIGVGLTAGKMLHGGVSSLGDQGAGDLRDTAGDVYDTQKRLAESSKGLSYDKANLAIGRAGDIRESGQATAGFGARKSMTNLVQTGQATSAKQGFASDRSITAKQELSAGQVQGQYQSQMKSLTSAYQFSAESADIAKDAADITYEKDIGAAQRELNYALAEADDVDRGFFEGMFS